MGVLTLTLASAALAELPQAAAAHPAREIHSVAALAIFGGLVVFAVILSLLHLYERARWTRRERELAASLDVLRGAHDRAEMLLNAERQIIVTWDRRSEPVVEGDISLAIHGERPTSGYARRVLAFGTWLPAADTTAVEAAVEALRARGTSFDLSLRTQTGQSIEAHGQAVAGRALLRLRETSQERCEIADLRATLDETRRGLSALSSLLDAIPQPVWRRTREGGLSWVNAAYVAAVEAESREKALDAGLELFDRPARESIAREEVARTAGLTRGVPRLSAIVAGSRRMLDVFEASLDSGRVGIAIDVSELESVRADLQRQMNANVRTLDQLPTAVAMFDVSQRLIFHNAAYRQLWDLDQAFLDGRPADGEILDHLRAERKLEEHADFRGWKQGVLAAYRAAEANQTWWYLPDGRTLRVVADPNPQGGLTYLFDDVSDHLNAESRYNALRRLQAETLDTLAEPVAVFGADGRLTLANRAFSTVWRLDPALLEERPHVDAVIAACRELAPADEPWIDIRDAVVGLESRTARSCRLEVVDGTVLDCAAQPLPEGATLLTLIDITASVNVERASPRRTTPWRRPRSCATPSSTTSPTSCAHRSPTSSASRSSWATRRSAPSTSGSANIPTTSCARRRRSSSSSTTSSISPRSMPARSSCSGRTSTSRPPSRRPCAASRTGWPSRTSPWPSTCRRISATFTPTGNASARSCSTCSRTPSASRMPGSAWRSVPAGPRTICS